MLCAQTESLNTEEVGPYVYVSPSLLLLRLLGDQALVDIGDHTCGGWKEDGLCEKHFWIGA